ncbi:flagellar assembly protein FliH [Geodermatophilus normandii]|uniref:Flagellar assembly protein FliH n=1 Tax=Geodermatophilus normandii TaxID=1137989 RepID=A0A317QFB5_9ACTN|nr:FliH/SctL family protein [Geodermatophilus normandii]PWW21296.1 flagellar assembly protein FliH [Geodermatophilus normandii]
MLLRGASATAAAPYRSVPGTTVPPRPRPEPQQAGPSPVVATAPEVVVERRGTVRRAADVPVPNGRGVRRLGDVYAEELARLREFARAEGYDAGHAEGLAEAGRVVARAEADAAARLADVQARWERRMASATAALGAAVSALDAAAVPTAEDVRETLLGGVLTLVEDLLGREVSASTTAGLDAVRRALTLLPSDAPAVVRLHPDDLAEVPPRRWRRCRRRSASSATRTSSAPARSPSAVPGGSTPSCPRRWRGCGRCCPREHDRAAGARPPRRPPAADRLGGRRDGADAHRRGRRRRRG